MVDISKPVTISGKISLTVDEKDGKFICHAKVAIKNDYSNTIWESSPKKNSSEEAIEAAVNQINKQIELTNRERGLA